MTGFIIILSVFGIGMTAQYLRAERETRRAEHEAVLEALGSLSDSDQEVILLRSYEELSTAEIAVVLDCTREAAKKRLSRALKRLRKAAGSSGLSPSGRPSRAIQEGGNG